MRRVRASAHGRRGSPRHRLNLADITFVVLTKDEERRIDGCLQSVPDVSRRIVYDAESVDDTARIARTHLADVVIVPWSGFGHARIAAAALVRTPWTFMLDADERLTPHLRDELAGLEVPVGVDAYSVPRMNFFCGRWIRGAGWWPDRLVRLFRTGRATLTSRYAGSAYAVHETWSVAGRCLQLSAPLEHRTYPTIGAYRNKFVYYTTLEAGGMRGRATMGSVVWALIVAPLRVLWLLLGRRGILDGWRGVYVCAASAAYPAVVRWKALFG